MWCNVQTVGEVDGKQEAILEQRQESHFPTCADHNETKAFSSFLMGKRISTNNISDDVSCKVEKDSSDTSRRKCDIFPGKPNLPLLLTHMLTLRITIIISVSDTPLLGLIMPNNWVRYTHLHVSARSIGDVELASFCFFFFGAFWAEQCGAVIWDQRNLIVRSGEITYSAYFAILNIK